MKKILSTILFCTLTLAMLSMPGVAEENAANGGLEAVPFEEQIAVLWEEVGAEYPFDELEANHPLTGRWLPAAIQRYEDNEAYEAAGMFDLVTTLNDDGTITMEQRDGSETTYVGVLEVREGALRLVGRNAETGEKAGSFQILAYDLTHRYDNCTSLVMQMGNEWVCYYHEDFYEGFTAAEEPDPALFRSVSSMEEIQQVSQQWEMDYGMTNGREICFDDFDVMNIQGDTFLMAVPPDDPELGGGAFIGTSYTYGPYVVIGITGFNEDGEGEGAAVYANESKKPVVIRLYGDGEDARLVVREEKTSYVFKVMTIDPLTEYTDKEIVKAVQGAMNDEGYECGTPDGISGKKTVAAISAYQADNGLAETGTVTEELLQSLRDKGYNL